MDDVEVELLEMDPAALERPRRGTARRENHRRHLVEAHLFAAGMSLGVYGQLYHALPNLDLSLEIARIIVCAGFYLFGSLVLMMFSNNITLRRRLGDRNKGIVLAAGAVTGLVIGAVLRLVWGV
ncbi:MAG: hypothetical protein LIP77_09645 [Planctomycetes bacterium]|nr:hypothetical protein [Planctomycetota bacterium]